MNDKERGQIARALRSIAAAHAETMELMEHTFRSLSKELALDPATFWRSQEGAARSRARPMAIDREMLSVEFHERRCFLGNTLLFKFLDRLARRPNVYVSYTELLSDIWEGPRSDAAVRSVVKTLRKKLRQAKMHDLADSIDGTVPHHYALVVDG